MAKLNKEDVVDKSVEESLDEIEQLEKELEEVKRKKVAAMPRCGHENSHSVDMDNKPDALKCTLEEGHAGNHEALHVEKDPSDPEGTVEVTAFWSDAAGKGYVHADSPPPGWTDGASGEMTWTEK